MLIELWRDMTVREDFARGRSLKEISDETGLAEEDVLQREVELRRIAVRSALHTAGTPV
jgi:phytoene/squalene synthetase